MFSNYINGTVVTERDCPECCEHSHITYTPGTVQKDDYGNIVQLQWTPTARFSFCVTSDSWLPVFENSIILNNPGQTPCDVAGTNGDYAYNTVDFKCWRYKDCFWIEQDDIAVDSSSKTVVLFSNKNGVTRAVVKNFRGEPIRTFESIGNQVTISIDDNFSNLLKQGYYAMDVYLVNTDVIRYCRRIPISVGIYSVDEHPDHQCQHPNVIVPNPSMKDEEKNAWELRRAFLSVSTISERDSLDPVTLPHGKLVRVSNTDDGVKYYSWDQATYTWKEEYFNAKLPSEDDTLVSVKSVNNKTGDVILTPDDVGAQPKGDYAQQSEVVKLTPQSLTPEQQSQVKSNLGITETDCNGGDWNQNDTTSTDYIKNRTHYVTFTPVATYLETQQITFEQESSYERNVWDEEDNIIGTETYYRYSTVRLPCNSALRPSDHMGTVIVTVNGVEYTPEFCEVSFDGETSVDASVGDLFIRTFNKNDGKDFVSYFLLRKEDSVEESVTLTISIVRYLAEYTKLPLEYIPVTYVADQNNNSPISSSGVYRALQSVKDTIPKTYTDIEGIPCYHIPTSYKSICLPNRGAYEYEGCISGTSPINISDREEIRVWSTDPSRNSQYRVLFGGDYYTCTCWQDSEMEWILYLGNGSIYDESFEDTGEPFCVRINIDLENTQADLYYRYLEENFYGGDPKPFCIEEETPERLLQLDEKFLPDSIARTSDIKEVFYVTMTDNGDGTYTADKTCEEARIAHESGYIVKCKINITQVGGMDFVLPVCAVQDGVVYYGGASSVLTISVAQLPDNTTHVEVQQLSTTDDTLITDDEIDALQSKLDGGIIDE